MDIVFQSPAAYLIMYIPKHFLSESWEAQEDIIKRYPLATVITNDSDGLYANHFPFLLHKDESSGKYFLHAHVAKRNPQLQAFRESKEVLVIFQSRDSYISPSYYPGKPETHKYVPTWDFAAVHIRGKPRVIDDPTWVRKQLEGFTDQNELNRSNVWKVSDAPENYLKVMQKVIIGLEIEIVNIESKFKFEQNMKPKDIEGVIKGLTEEGLDEVCNIMKSCNKGVIN